MKHSTQSQNLQQSQTIAEKTHSKEFGTLEVDKSKNTELIEKHQIENTPFWILGNKDDGYFLAMGKHRLCDLQKTKEQVQDYYNQHQWELIMQVAMIVFTDLYTEQNKTLDAQEHTINQYKTKENGTHN